MLTKVYGENERNTVKLGKLSTMYFLVFCIYLAAIVNI